jgi:hypothetical protein
LFGPSHIKRTCIWFLDRQYSTFDIRRTITMVWVSNIIDDTLVLELSKESFITIVDTWWGTSYTSLWGVDSFVPIVLGALCTPLLVVDSLGPIVLESIPTIGLSWMPIAIALIIACDPSRMIKPLSWRSTWTYSPTPTESNMFGMSIWTMSSKSMTTSSSSIVIDVAKQTRNNIKP